MYLKERQEWRERRKRDKNDEREGRETSKGLMLACDENCEITEEFLFLKRMRMRDIHSQGRKRMMGGMRVTRTVLFTNQMFHERVEEETKVFSLSRIVSLSLSLYRVFVRKTMEHRTHQMCV